MYSSALRSGRPKFAGVKLDSNGTMRNCGNRLVPRALRPAARLWRVNTSSRLSASVMNLIPSVRRMLNEVDDGVADVSSHLQVNEDAASTALLEPANEPVEVAGQEQSEADLEE